MSMDISGNYGNMYGNICSYPQRESGKDNVQEYYEKLCRKFSGINFHTGKGVASSSENNIVLNLSSECLKKMASDPAFAKKIENDIAGIPAAHKQMFAKARGDGMEIQGFSVRINADGSMQCSCSGSTRTSAGNGNSSAGKVQEREKTEEKSTYRSRRQYSKYLRDKYACLTPTKDSSVSINPGLLSKAASDPKTASWLEHTLSQMPGCINKICENSAQNGARLISLDISIDSEDCITTKCVGVFESDPGTEESKKMLEEAKKRNKERAEEWERQVEKNKEKKAEQEKRAEKAKQESAENRQYDITVAGTDMAKITEKLISKIGMGNNAISTMPKAAGFDVKA